MARARAIDTRLERMVPAMEEYFTKGIFSKAQLQEVGAARRNHEYKLVARPLLYVDVKRAIDYELELEAQIATYLAGTETQLKHRNDIVDRVAHIYQIAIPCLEASITTGGAVGAGAAAASGAVDPATRDRDLLERQYLAFLRDFNRENELSRYLAAALQKAPSKVAPWVFSVEWELEKGNADNARSIAQEALKHIAADPRAWGAVLRVETSFVNRIAAGVLAADSVVKSKQDKKASGATDDNNDDAATTTTMTTVSQRFEATNAPLAKVVLDGELIVASGTAAAQSKALGIGLLDEVARTLVAAEQLQQASLAALPKKQQGRAAQLLDPLHVTGRFFSRFFSDCAERALPQQQQQQQSADSGKKTAVALSAQVERRTLAVSSLVALITCPWRYFGFSPSAAISAHQLQQRGNSRKKQQQQPQAEAVPVTAVPAVNKCWHPRAFLDADGQLPACGLGCLVRAATRTLAALVRLSRRTCHPAAARAALAFAEELAATSLSHKGNLLEQEPYKLTLERIIGILSASDDETNAAASSCPRCSAALDESITAAERFVAARGDSLRNDLIASSSAAGGSAASKRVNEFPWAQWVSADFAAALSAHHFIIAALVTSSDNGDSSGAAAAVADAAGLELRVRTWFSLPPAQRRIRGFLPESQALLAALDGWFQREFGAASAGSATAARVKQQTELLLASETVAEQTCTLLVARALLRASCDQQSQQQSVFSVTDRRRDRTNNGTGGSSSSDDDDDSNGRAALTTVAAGDKSGHRFFAPLHEIVALYKQTHPSTTRQIDTRGKCMAVVVACWLEFAASHVPQAGSSNAAPEDKLCRFPFVAQTLFVGSGGNAEQQQKVVSCAAQSDVFAATARGIIDRCVSVLPAAGFVLVNVGAALEFSLIQRMRSAASAAARGGASAGSSNKTLVTAAETRMRRFFETAVAQSSRDRAMWVAWKACETDLGNLQMAAAVHRRAAAALGDSRI